jgi:hypothetical protein
VHAVSVSRRTDIPAFYAPWFANRLQAGFCHWLNPYSGAVYRVSLRPEDCFAFVFWTRNPRPMLPVLDRLEAGGYAYYFHVSITGYGAPLELHNPPLPAAIGAVRALAQRIGPERVLWRYDPIVFSSITPFVYHLDHFAAIAAQLEGLTHRCSYSFLDFYGKTRRNLDAVRAEHGIAFEDPGTPERDALLAGFVEIAAQHGITLYGCCEADHARIPAIQPGRCLDPDLLAAMVGERMPTLKPQPTREHCGCVRAVDIGAYDTCLFGCRYCYATTALDAARARRAAHDPADTILVRPPHLAGVDLDTLVKPPAQQDVPAVQPSLFGGA